MGTSFGGIIRWVQKRAGQSVDKQRRASALVKRLVVNLIHGGLHAPTIGRPSARSGGDAEQLRERWRCVARTRRRRVTPGRHRRAYDEQGDPSIVRVARRVIRAPLVLVLGEGEERREIEGHRTAARPVFRSQDQLVESARGLHPDNLHHSSLSCLAQLRHLGCGEAVLIEVDVGRTDAQDAVRRLRRQLCSNRAQQVAFLDPACADPKSAHLLRDGSRAVIGAEHQHPRRDRASRRVTS